ncbi:MAG: uroporphyrinogen-III synthase [Deltaproteobacteria bacterium]|nr:uroporphyrinogen-III synthase [Deltaproteobacteria bacterium]
MSSSSLSGRTIGIPESRELDRLAEMLQSLGAETLRCPLVAILDAPDPVPVDAWLEALVRDEFNDLVILTGEGLRRLLHRAERTGRHAEAVTALGRLRTVTRGPKPARALKDVGLSPTIAARVPTSTGVAELLATLDLKGRTVGLQLYGTEPNLPLVSAIESFGATVRSVAPYVYAPAVDEERVQMFIAAMGAGSMDAVAFTSASQVDRLFEVAEKRQLLDALRVGLGRTRVASVGPVVTESLTDRGVAVSIGLDHGFVMKNLCNAIAAALGPK